MAAAPMLRYAKVAFAHDQPAEAEAEGAVRRFLGQLRPGQTLEGRWSIERVKGVHMGAIALVMRDGGGERFQVDVLRRDDSPEAPGGISTTRSLALFLSNRGDGQRPTTEEHGLGVMALGRVLARREEAGHRPPSLLTFSERRGRHPLGSYSIV